MTKNTSLRLKVLSFISIILLGGLQYYLFKQNEMAVLRGNDLLNVRGKIVHYEPFNTIIIEYKLIDAKTKIKAERKLDNNYDPFVNIDTSESLSITYNKKETDLFYVNGYDDIPSSFFFYFICGIAILAQIILIGILIGYIDENLNIAK